MRVLALALVLLAGCAGEAPPIDYAGSEPVVVPINQLRAHIEALDVMMNPRDKRLALVKADRTTLRSQGWATNPINWVARLDKFRPLYADALIGVLAKQGKQCSIVDNDPIAYDFAIEFRYRCEGDT